MNGPQFPPLFSGQAVAGQTDPFRLACETARAGCDAGLVVHNLDDPGFLRAAMVFAPDVPLDEALTMLPLCAVGLQNALGALAPPEVAVQLGWDGGIHVNGGHCGSLAVAASTDDPKAEPDWLVIGLDLALLPQDDNPGDAPDRTSLYAEGCGEVHPIALTEAWVRHTLVGINRLLDDGPAALHTEWTALAFGIGERQTMDGRTGVFIGVDERFGMLLRDEDTTHLIPLTHLQEDV